MALCLPGQAIVFDVPTGDTLDINTPITEIIVKLGNGTLILSGTEDNAGAFASVEVGTMLLAKDSSPSVHALGGNTQTVFAGTTLRLGGTGGDQIFDSSEVIIQAGGLFDLNGRSERIAFYGGGGHIVSSTGTGTLIFGTDLSFAINNPLHDGGGILNATKVGTSQASWLVANTHSGLTTVAEGTLALSGNHVASPASMVHVASGATLHAQIFTNTLGGLEGSGTVQIGLPMSTEAGFLSVGANHADTTFSGVILPSTGSTFTKVGNGTLTLSGTADNVGLGVTVASGTLVPAKDSSATVHALGADSAVASGATLHLAGTGGDQIRNDAALTVNGTFDVNDRAETLTAVSGSGNILLGPTGALTAGNSTDATFFGAITTTGAGTFLVTGTVSGPLQVNGGTLGGNGTLGNVTLQTGGTIAPGNSPGILSLSDFEWIGGTILFELGAGADLVHVSGTLSCSGGPKLFTFEDNGWQVGETYTLINFDTSTLDLSQFGFTNSGGFDGSFSYGASSLQFTLAAIPEPSTGLLLIGGLSLLLALRQSAKRR